MDEALMKRLEEMSEIVKRELREGTLQIGGITVVRNSLKRDSPYSGACHDAVARLKELAPDLGIVTLSFTRERRTLWERGRHTIGEVVTSDGMVFVDPTIEQYLPGAKSVYTPGEYPIQMRERGMKRFK